MNRETLLLGSSGPLYPVYTIGHSTRSILKFVELLQVGKIETAVDIRSTGTPTVTHLVAAERALETV